MLVMLQRAGPGSKVQRKTVTSRIGFGRCRLSLGVGAHSEASSYSMNRLNARLQALASCPAETKGEKRREKEGKRERKSERERGDFGSRGSACWSCIAPQIELEWKT